MAGERLAKITVQAALSHNDNQRGYQTTSVTFTLGSHSFTYQRGGDNGQYLVPDPDNAGESYAQQAVQNMLTLLAFSLGAQNLPYQVSAPQQVKTVPDPNAQGGPEIPVIEFSITATDYSGGALNFAAYSGSDGWSITQNVTSIAPVFAKATVTDATSYGAKDGAITLAVSGGDSGGFYLYRWSDGAQTRDRQNVGAGTYVCQVSDPGTGASTSVTVTVGSDARLDVQVQQVGNDVHLVVSGGLAPYAYAWLDGPTAADRLALAAGYYSCTVTDGRGVQVTVSVTISTLNLFYFSRNPVTLTLQATDLASKPGLQFLCEVYVESAYLSGTFVPVGGLLSQPADATGATVFDVSTLLDAYVAPDFPQFGEYGAARADKAFTRFYLQHSEQWTGSGAPTYTVRQTHYLVYGGLDFFEYATQAYFTVYRPQVHPFLSWEPAQRTLFFDQPEYLTYQHDSLSDDSFTVLVTFTRATGTTGSVVLAQRAGVQCFELWRLGVGLPQLQAALGRQVPADVVAWAVHVENAAGVAVTETRYYQLSDELPLTRRYFLYANSLGGINTLAAYGKGKLEVSLSSVLVQRSLQPGYPADAGETYTASVAGVPVLTCNTGYLSSTQREALHDFLLSEEIRYCDSDRYRPGSLQPVDSLPLDDDDAGLLPVEFAFVLPTKRRYTPTLPLHY